MSKRARHSLEIGAKYPYDADRPAIDWAHAAARGVLADLCDRRTIKWGFQDVDDDVRIEIVDTLADIIREANK